MITNCLSIECQEVLYSLQAVWPSSGFGEVRRFSPKHAIQACSSVSALFVWMWAMWFKTGLQTEESRELGGPSLPLCSPCRLMEHGDFLLPKLCSPWHTHLPCLLAPRGQGVCRKNSSNVSEECGALQLHGSTACRARHRFDPAFSETSLPTPVLCLNRSPPRSPAGTVCCVCCLLRTWRCALVGAESSQLPLPRVVLWKPHL